MPENVTPAAKCHPRPVKGLSGSREEREGDPGGGPGRTVVLARCHMGLQSTQSAGWPTLAGGRLATTSQTDLRLFARPSISVPRVQNLSGPANIRQQAQYLASVVPTFVSAKPKRSAHHLLQ